MPPTTDLQVNIRAQENVTHTLNNVESSIIRFVGAISASIIALGTIAFPARSAIAFERALADVAKTTGFASEEIEDLGLRLRELSTILPNSAIDLTQIAAAAGQAGLGEAGSDAVLNFTESVARAAVTLDLVEDQAATAAAKIVSIFDIDINRTENIFSTINELSNTTSANAEQLIDVIRRVGPIAGLTFTQVAAIGAQAIQLGLSPETAGTSLIKIFSSFETRAPQFARLLGLEIGEFLALGADERFRLFLDNLVTQSADTRARLITSLTGGGRIFALVDKQVRDAANGYAILDSAVESSESAFLSGQSSIEEYQRVARTLDARINTLGNNFADLALEVGAQALPILSEAVETLRLFAQQDETREFFIELGVQLAGIVESVVDFISTVDDFGVSLDTVVTAFQVLLGLGLLRFFVGLGTRIAIAGYNFVALIGSLRASAISLGSFTAILEANTIATVRNSAALAGNAAATASVTTANVAASASLTALNATTSLFAGGFTGLLATFRGFLGVALRLFLPLTAIVGVFTSLLVIIPSVVRGIGNLIDSLSEVAFVGAVIDGIRSLIGYVGDLAGALIDFPLDALTYFLTELGLIEAQDRVYTRRAIAASRRRQLELAREASRYRQLIDEVISFGEESIDLSARQIAGIPAQDTNLELLEGFLATAQARFTRQFSTLNQAERDVISSQYLAVLDQFSSILSQHDAQLLQTALNYEENRRQVELLNAELRDLEALSLPLDRLTDDSSVRNLEDIRGRMVRVFQATINALRDSGIEALTGTTNDLQRLVSNLNFDPALQDITESVNLLNNTLVEFDRALVNIRGNAQGLLDTAVKDAQDIQESIQELGVLTPGISDNFVAIAESLKGLDIPALRRELQAIINSQARNLQITSDTQRAAAETLDTTLQQYFAQTNLVDVLRTQHQVQESIAKSARGILDNIETEISSFSRRIEQTSRDIDNAVRDRNLNIRIQNTSSDRRRAQLEARGIEGQIQEDFGRLTQEQLALRQSANAGDVESFREHRAALRDIQDGIAGSIQQLADISFETSRGRVRSAVPDFTIQDLGDNLRRATERTRNELRAVSTALDEAARENLRAASERLSEEAATLNVHETIINSLRNTFNGLGQSIDTATASLQTFRDAFNSIPAAALAQLAQDVIAATPPVVNTLNDRGASLQGQVRFDPAQAQQVAEELPPVVIPAYVRVIDAQGVPTFTESNRAPVPGFAEGGQVRGPGTGKSDSILARLSNGEYVIDALTARFFGSGFFSTLQSLAKKGQIPKFAAGGPVNTITSSRQFGNNNMINLQLPGGGSIGPLGASDNVVAELKEYISKQSRKTGRKR